MIPRVPLQQPRTVLTTSADLGWRKHPYYLAASAKWYLQHVILAHRCPVVRFLSIPTTHVQVDLNTRGVIPASPAYSSLCGNSISGSRSPLCTYKAGKADKAVESCIRGRNKTVGGTGYKAGRDLQSLQIEQNSGSQKPADFEIDDIEPMRRWHGSISEISVRIRLNLSLDLEDEERYLFRKCIGRLGYSLRAPWRPFGMSRREGGENSNGRTIQQGSATDPAIRSSEVPFGVVWGSEKSSPSKISAVQYLDRFPTVRHNDLLLSDRGEGQGHPQIHCRADQLRSQHCLRIRMASNQTEWVGDGSPTRANCTAYDFNEPGMWVNFPEPVRALPGYIALDCRL
ncbi:hypothetical protein V8F20_000443 [Naviculisporaceae sp. PSN 640]